MKPASVRAELCDDAAPAADPSFVVESSVSGWEMYRFTHCEPSTDVDQLELLDSGELDESRVEARSWKLRRSREHQRDGHTQLKRVQTLGTYEAWKPQSLRSSSASLGSWP